MVHPGHDWFVRCLRAAVTYRCDVERQDRSSERQETKGANGKLVGAKLNTGAEESLAITVA